MLRIYSQHSPLLLQKTPTFFKSTAKTQHYPPSDTHNWADQRRKMVECRASAARGCDSLSKENQNHLKACESKREDVGVADGMKFLRMLH